MREGAGGWTQKGEAVLPPAPGDTGCRVPGHTCPLIGCPQHLLLSWEGAGSVERCRRNEPLRVAPGAAGTCFHPTELIRVVTDTPF